MLREQGLSEIFLGQYVLQSLIQRKRRDRTGAGISIMRRRRAMLRVVGRQPAQLLRLPLSAKSGGRREHRTRANNKLIYRMERPSPANQD